MVNAASWTRSLEASPPRTLSATDAGGSSLGSGRPTSSRAAISRSKRSKIAVLRALVVEHVERGHGRLAQGPQHLVARVGEADQGPHQRSARRAPLQSASSRSVAISSPARASARLSASSAAAESLR